MGKRLYADQQEAYTNGWLDELDNVVSAKEVMRLTHRSLWWVMDKVNGGQFLSKKIGNTIVINRNSVIWYCAIVNQHCDLDILY